MCFKKPKTGKVIIATIEIAYEAEEEAWLADEISALLSERGACDEGSGILDWRYIVPDPYEIEIPEEILPDLEEGGIFSFTED